MSGGARKSPQVSLRPLRGAVLIGGASRRMGVPKHRIDLGRESMLERTVRILERLARLHPECRLHGEAVVLGAGELPDSLRDTPRLIDAPGLVGPVAGIVAALRSSRNAGDDYGWLILACDLPRIDAPTLAWLTGERRPGRAAVQARVAATRVEPFPGIYEMESLEALEGIGRSPGARASLQRLDELVDVAHPEVPSEFVATFRGANTPEEFAAIAGSTATERTA